MKNLDKQILISFNESKYQDAINHLNRLNPLLVELSKKYAHFSTETEMDSLKLGTVKDILTRGRRTIEDLIGKYVESQSKPLQHHYMQFCNSELGKLDPILGKITFWSTMASNKQIFWANIEPQINWTTEMTIEIDDQIKQVVKQIFEVRISDGVDIELHSKYQASIGAINEFISFAKENGLMIPQGGLNALFSQSERMAMYPTISGAPEMFLPSRRKNELNKLAVPITHEAKTN